MIKSRISGYEWCWIVFWIMAFTSCTVIQSMEFMYQKRECNEATGG